VELAEAQLAVGRDPEIEADGDGAELALNGELADEEATALEAGPGRGGGGRGGDGAVAARPEPGGHGHAAESHPHLLARLIAFLQGCWHELQRVQWPDRRQVMQATGVVIGFVIVAGLFLGASDWVAHHIVKFVLK
jgi:preprotein translocase SecE subunit